MMVENNQEHIELTKEEAVEVLKEIAPVIKASHKKQLWFKVEHIKMTRALMMAVEIHGMLEVKCGLISDTVVRANAAALKAVIDVE